MARDGDGRRVARHGSREQCPVLPMLPMLDEIHGPQPDVFKAGGPCWAPPPLLTAPLCSGTGGRVVAPEAQHGPRAIHVKEDLCGPHVVLCGWGLKPALHKTCE